MAGDWRSSKFSPKFHFHQQIRLKLFRQEELWTNSCIDRVSTGIVHNMTRAMPAVQGTGGSMVGEVPGLKAQVSRGRWGMGLPDGGQEERQ